MGERQGGSAEIEGNHRGLPLVSADPSGLLRRSLLIRSNLLIRNSLLPRSPARLISSGTNPAATDGTLNQLRRFAGRRECAPTLQSGIPGRG
jgi:hypothetical protein